jgi:uncharacterized protein YndB with AHSA1/START domain
MSAAPIEITVSGDLPCSAEHVYETLWHCEHFPEWWPVSVKLHDANSQAIFVQPLPMVRIQMIRTESESPQRVVYAYASGPFRGEGEWSVSDMLERPGWAHVDYTVRLRPVNTLVALGASTPLFRFKHRRDILAIMNRICEAKAHSFA